MSESAQDRSRPLLALFDRQAWTYFFRHYRHHARRLLLLSLAAAARAVLLVPVLLMIREIFDVAIPTGDHEWLIVLAIGILAVRLLNSGLLILIRRAIIESIQQVVMEIREDLVAHLYRLSRGFYAGADSDSLQARIVQDTARVDQMSNALFSAIVPALFSILVLILLLFFLQWQLTLVACLAVPLAFLINRYAGQTVKRHTQVFQQAFEQFSKGVSFSLRYMGLTQEQGAPESELARRRAELNDLRYGWEAMAKANLLCGQLNEAVRTVSGMLLVIVGGLTIMAGTLTLGEFIAFYAAAGMLNGHLGTLTGGLPDILSGNESLHKLQALRAEDAVHPYSGSRALDFGGRIAFQRVSFSYGEDGLLQDVDLAIQPGETTLIAGPNGIGKSTLLHLLMGFWRPQQGQLLADGVPYDELDMTALRRAIGFVPQRPDIFSGSLAENIRYGREEVSERQMEEAARISGAHAFIETLPEGYESQAGDDGRKLSGGERQKLAIARALVARPALLILDEPTNHLDADSVSAILRNLREEARHMALLVVSHDQRLAAYADRSFRLEEGRLQPTQGAEATFAGPQAAAPAEACPALGGLS